MNQAQGAIDAARAAGADQFARQEYDAAVQALEKSRAAVALRDYRQALSYALDARERAQAAARLGADEKARVRAEIDRALHTAEIALDRARVAWKEARSARVAARQLAGPQAEIDTADDKLRAARAAIERDDYAAARKAIDGVAARLDTLVSEIDAAVAARASRRPGRRSTTR
jgi:hypothetical protein